MSEKHLRPELFGEKNEPPQDEIEQRAGEGQVSEASAMPDEDADTPISDGQAVAGNPDADSAYVGRTGPNARTGSEHDAREKQARGVGEDRKN